MRPDHETGTDAGATPTSGSGDVADDADPAKVHLRQPRDTDAAAMWELVRDSGSLDLNSPYLYLLICTDHAATSVVATDDAGNMLGFVAAYRPPQDPGAVFVWQVGVAQAARGRGLGRRLIMATLATDGNRDVRELVATVTPSNAASMALFKGLGRDLGAPVAERERFGVGLFPADAGAHEPEVELRVGPLPTAGDSA